MHRRKELSGLNRCRMSIHVQSLWKTDVLRNSLHENMSLLQIQLPPCQSPGSLWAPLQKEPVTKSATIIPGPGVVRKVVEAKGWLRDQVAAIGNITAPGAVDLMIAVLRDYSIRLKNLALVAEELPLTPSGTSPGQLQS